MSEVNPSHDPSVVQPNGPTRTLDPQKTASYSTVDFDAERTGTQAPSVGDPDVNEPLPTIPHYEMLGTIGRGGMGVVLKARDLRLNRLVAIKLPLKNHIASQQDRQRFLREAQSAAKLEHPNICAIYDVGEVDDRPYIAMAFVEGSNLDKWAKDTPRTPHDVARMVAVLAHAVGYAHEQKVMHRDLKPSNVLVSVKANQPVLMDFGLAKEIGEQQSEMTHSGQIMGTPAYMAPEQAAGDIKHIGAPADVYALGAILYKLLTGRQVFESKIGVGELLKKVQTEEPPSPRSIKSSIHIDLETICLKCLVKAPEGRYESAGALADDLERFTKGEPIHARREGLGQRLGRKLRRNRIVVGISAVFSIAAILFVVVALNREARLRQEGERNRVNDQFIQKLQDAEQSDWSREKLDALDDAYQKYAAQLPDKRGEADERISAAIYESAKASLQVPSFTDTARGRVERLRGLLGQRNSPLEVALRKELESRLAAWETTVRVESPFTDFEKAFGKVVVPFENQGSQLIIPPLPGVEQLIILKPSSEGNSRISVRFGDAWQKCQKFGTALNHPSTRVQKNGYVFTLQTKSEKGGTPLFQEALEKGNHCELSIIKNGVLVRYTDIPPEALREKELRFLAQREGSRLMVQVNSHPPLYFDDPFLLPASGHFGLMIATQAVNLLELQLSRQAVPVQSSPLEIGDALVAREQYADALQFYQEQAVRSAGREIGVAARFKEGVCLHHLNRRVEADKVFRDVSDSTFAAWSRLGLCYLIDLALRSKQFEQADQHMERLLREGANTGGLEFALALPEDLRVAIDKYYRQSIQGLGVLSYDPERVRKMERALRIQELLDVQQTYISFTRNAYVRALRANGNRTDMDIAVRKMDEWLRILPVDSRDSALVLLREFGWLMRELNEPRRALEEIDRRLFVGPGIVRQGMESLLIERARLLLAANPSSGHADAERDLEKYLAMHPDPAQGYRDFSDTCLMLGFLRERRGDVTGAVEIWSRGFYPKDLEEVGLDGGVAGGIGTLNVVFLGMLANNVSNEDFLKIGRTIFLKFLDFDIGDLKNLSIKRRLMLQMGVQMVRSAFVSKEGHEVIRKFAFQEYAYREYFTAPIEQAFVHTVSTQAFDNKMTEQEARLNRQTFHLIMAARGRGEFPAITEPQVFEIGLAWMGLGDPAKLSVLLTSDFKAHTAYLFGKRFAMLKREKDALDFYQIAVDSAKANAEVRSLAEAEIKKLGSKK